MYLKIGSALRPFVEANVEPSYQFFYDGQRRLYKTGVTLRIEGRIVQQTAATQSGMTQLIKLLQQQSLQANPDIILLEDDGATPSALSLYANQCLQGPDCLGLELPSNTDRIYVTSCPYSLSYYAEVQVGSGGGNPVIEFHEEIDDSGSGGWERVHVGGAINPPEEQIASQYSVYRYRQFGSAVGAYALPSVPPPIWPGALKRPRPQLSYGSPQMIGNVLQNFRISWQYEYESAYALFGRPHTFTGG